ncbi:hypothetical protein CI109_105522 [Kwoniella shandongensis]|uniref:Uncharacterized protein n=1 Tax=Kwoniella shandongensis TaxID=1734106 RepID=A0A5M6C3S6_9TREE|nr:uncharacterized protein CI109_002243 [Kwoniella shandongensis]KAA5529350.1 hypothetical protein CI109_002243 [Kwoniella shandongensis]
MRDLIVLILPYLILVTLGLGPTLATPIDPRADIDTASETTNDISTGVGIGVIPTPIPVTISVSANTNVDGERTHVETITVPDNSGIEEWILVTDGITPTESGYFGTPPFQTGTVTGTNVRIVDLEEPCETSTSSEQEKETETVFVTVTVTNTNSSTATPTTNASATSDGPGVNLVAVEITSTIPRTATTTTSTSKPSPTLMEPPTVVAEEVTSTIVPPTSPPPSPTTTSTPSTPPAPATPPVSSTSASPAQPSGSGTTPSLPVLPNKTSSSSPSSLPAPSASSATSSDGDGTSPQTWVDLHNAARKKYGAADVVWDESLAKVAEEHAKLCNKQHTKAAENLQWGDGTPTPQGAVDAWMAEASQYDWNNPVYSEATGHFTQVVWKDTTRIGCYIAQCAAGKVSSDAGFQTACEYDPAGNYVNAGEFQANVGKAV